MARTKIVKSAGRFGVRYGQSLRKRTTAIEFRQRKKQACPFCSGRAVRTSKGIWNCKKCGKRFAGHTYYLASQFIGNSKKDLGFAESFKKDSKPEDLKKEKKANNKGSKK